ncbi:hypothetical protein PtB15_12B594 [Puccinia triticina]|nr:hypothetical protein PtB15_12B594 [Puccinia triticina]
MNSSTFLTSENLRSLRFTKKSPSRKGTAIAVPNARTRPPTAPPIDLTLIDQSPTSKQKRAPPQFGQAYSPFKPPQSTSRRANPPQDDFTTKRSENDRFTEFFREAEAARPPSKKFKPTRVGKPQTNPPKTLQNRPLAEILGKARPTPLTSTASRHLSVNRTNSPASSASTRASPTSSRAQNTYTDSSRSASTSRTPLTRTSVAPLPKSNKKPPSPKASSSRKKLLNSSDMRDWTSTQSSLPDLPVPTRCSSSDSVSVVSKGKAPCQPSVDLMADIQNTLSVMGMSLQTDRPILPANYSTHDFDQTMPEDFSFEVSEMIDNPESLCPFCDEPLPQKPSTRLIETLKYLKNTPGVTKRKESNNPLALYLPPDKGPSSAPLSEDSRTFGTLMFPDEDEFPTSSDGRSPSESEDEERASLPSPPKPPNHSKKKRPRKSTSCEIEIVPTQKSSGKIKPSSHSDRSPPGKRFGAETNQTIYPAKAMKDGWKATVA